MSNLWDNGNDSSNKNKGPSQSLQLGFKLTHEFHKASTKQKKTGLLLTIGSVIGYLGLSSLEMSHPAIPALAFNAAIIANCAMDKASTMKMKNAFNEMSSHFDGETEGLLAPIEDLLAPIKKFESSDLNPLTNFKKDPIGVGITGFAFFWAPLIAPALYAQVIGRDDFKTNIVMGPATKAIAGEMKSRYPDLKI